jgi:hypothetical protein
MVSIDTIYQRVLAIANKEQRGYITPQEYNLLANQAQMQIFESYFYNRASKNEQEGVEAAEADREELMGKKLAPFTSIENMIGGTIYPSTVEIRTTSTTLGGGTDVDGDGGGAATITVSSTTADVFQTGRVFYNNQECTRVAISEARFAVNSTRHMAAVSKRPIFSDSNTPGDDIKLYVNGATPQLSGVTVECFRVPKTVNWGYVVVSNVALFNNNPAVSVDFELHKSEADTLVNKILELAGIVMNKPGLAQLASHRDAAEVAMQNMK